MLLLTLLQFIIRSKCWTCFKKQVLFSLMAFSKSFLKNSTCFPLTIIRYSFLVRRISFSCLILQWLRFNSSCLCFSKFKLSIKFWMKSLFLHTNLSNVDSKCVKLQSSFSIISSVNVLGSVLSSSGGGTIMLSSIAMFLGSSSCSTIVSSNTSFSNFGGGLGFGESSARIFSSISTRISKK